VKEFTAPSPLVVMGIGLTIAVVNLLTIRPTGGNATGFVVGYLVTPIVIGVLYWAWWRRRHPGSP
jgi:biotin transporter BioY